MLHITTALVFCILTFRVSSETTQAFCHPIDLPKGFSTKPSHWPHSTPLLRSHWQQETGPLQARQAVSPWAGWANVQYVFAFGDSYTTTNFTIDGAQPNSRNPFGNPPYPGITSANGPNYIDFLTTTYNESIIQVYNLGYGGAVVNPFLVPTPYGGPVQTFLSQVERQFLPLYADNPQVSWNASNSLFIIFLGINDIINSYKQQNHSLNYDIIKSYEGLVDELYGSGARNFLFLNVPPVDRTPGSLLLTDFERSLQAAYIGEFNFRLGALVYNLVQRHPDATAFSFDTNYLFTQVVDDPTQYQETAQYRNTTHYCAAYMNGTATLDSFDPLCGLPVNRYLWLNSLHPTYPMHNFMASQIVRLLKA